jgi:hypothetical protein
MSTAIYGERGARPLPGALSIAEGPQGLCLSAGGFGAGRRRIKPDGVRIETPADLLPHIRHFADRKPEHLLCASVNGANEVINMRVVTIGLLDRSPAHAREVFAGALMDRASAVIISQNHPADKKHGDQKVRQNPLR